VKCDEKRPCCSTCMLRGISCHYAHSVEGRPSSSNGQLAATSELTLDLRTNSRPITTPIICNTSAPRFGTPAWSSIESRELELMHHWCTRTGIYCTTTPLLSLTRPALRSGPGAPVGKGCDGVSPGVGSISIPPPVVGVGLLPPEPPLPGLGLVPELPPVAEPPAP
jgi:hypothetical protein